MQHPSTIATTRHRTVQRLLVLLAAVFSILIGTTTVASASTVSKPGVSSGLESVLVSKTRVGVAATPAGLFVGSQTPGNPIAVGEIGCGYDRIVSGSCVATNTPGAGGRALGNGIELTEQGVPKIIYREGAPSPSNLTPRAVDDGGLSFRDSLSNPVSSANRPVLQPGKDFIGIDTSKLPPGSVIYDNVPPGHVTVRGVTPEQLKAAVVERGKLPK